MRQMEFEEFKWELRNYMENEHPDMQWNINTINKVNQGEMTSITGIREGQTIVPCLYIDSFYEKYLQEDMTFSAIAKMVDYNIPIDVDQVLDLDAIKERFVAQLINKSNNAEMLQDMPHTDIAGDMAVVYREVISIGQDGMSSILINNDLLKEWNLPVEELHEIALNNTPKFAPIKIQKLLDVILDVIETENVVSDEELEMFREYSASKEDPLQMTVVTTQNTVNGATAILYPEFQEWLKSYGENAVILPSSVSEVICVKQEAGTSIEELKELVCEVNRNVVSKEEYLSDNVYQVKDGKLMAMEPKQTNDMDSIIERMLDNMEPPEPDFGLEM